MKRKPIILFTALILFSSVLLAQQKLVDSTIQNEKTQAQLKVINSASDKISKGIDNVFNGNALKRKNKPNKTATQDSLQVHAAQSTIEITIDSIDYSLLSHYSEILKLNPQVKEVKPQFSNNTGILKVAYTGASDEILNDLIKKSDGKLTVNEISDDKITLKSKS